MTIVLKAIGYMGLRGLLCGAVFGALYGTVLALIIGTIYGAVFGAIIGLPLGLIGGAILGAVTVLFFDPVENPGVFRLVMALCGGLVALVGAFLGFAGLLGGDGTLQERLVRLFSSEDFVYSVLPALIAAACATYVSNNYAKRHLDRSRQVV